MEVMKSKVYVLPDKCNRIIRCEGGYTMQNIQNIDEWVFIDEGTGIKYDHAQGNYFPMPLITNGGAYRYKLVDGKAVECTAEEIKAQEEAKRPVPAAPHNIMEGEYVTIDGVLYMATQNIPNGESVIVGQNAIVTTVEAQLRELKGE